MKPAKTNTGPEQTANLDQILASETDLVPSPGFAATVMDRVRQEAAALEPISFPWKRAFPGMIVAAAALVWCVVELLRMGIAEPRTFLLLLDLSALKTPGFESVEWIGSALSVSLLSWLLARRMIGRRGLV